MPALSERDLGHVEKLFNAVRSVLEYDHAHRTYNAAAEQTIASSSGRFTSTSTTTAASSPSPSSTGRGLSSSIQTGSNNKNAKAGPSSITSAPVSPLTPSKVLREHQDQQSERNRNWIPTPSTGAASSGVSERRLWAELAFLMWRVVGLQKRWLMAFVTNDPGLMLVNLARALLNFLKESCASFAGLSKTMRMRQVALLAQDRLLFLLRTLCNLKNCTVMLSETSGASSAAADGRAVFDSICAAVVAGEHFTWMSQIYVWFCDEAARFARSGGAIPSAYVYATHDALRCILGCCTNQEACARAFLYSEPVACVTYMFYGLKLRISTCDVLRPYEDDHPLKDTPAPTGHLSVTERQPTASSAGSASSLPPTSHLPSFTPNESASTSSVTMQQQQQWNSPIPLRPSGARYLKTRYFGLLTSASASASASQSPPQQQQQREGPIVVNCSAVAALVRPASLSANTSTSWAFDMPDLTREQLKQLVLGGRENSFDALLFAALDVVVEVLRVTGDYGHCMVLSTVSSLLLLSRKTIEVCPDPASAAATSTSITTNVSSPPPSLSQVVAMYENMTVLFAFLFALMQSLDDDALPSGTAGSGSPDAEKATAKSEKKARGGSAVEGPGTFSGGRNDASLASTALGAASRGGHVGFVSGSGTSTPALEGVAVATTAPRDTPQLREDLSQQLVHIVLQTDVHAMVAATTRVLQCDRTLFRVLHQFCVLDARVMEQPKLASNPADNIKNTSSNSSHTSPAAGARLRRNASQTLTVTDTTSMLNFGAGGNGPNGSRTLTGSLLPTVAVASPYSASAATLAPYLSSGSGGRGRRPLTLDGSSGNDGGDGGPVFNAAASFFTTANFGDLRQMVNEVGVGGSETPNGGGGLEGGTSGDLGGSHSSLHGSRGSGLGGLTSSAIASQLRSHSTQKLQQQRLRNRGGGKEKKGGNSSAASGGGGENFAKSFFKSFFGSGKKGGGLFTRGISNDVDEAAEENSDEDGGSWGGSSASSGSSSSSSDGDSDGGDSQGGDDGLGNTTITSGSGSPLSPHSFGAGSPRRQPPLLLRGSRTRCGRRRHYSRTKSRRPYSPWRDVPSYTALVSELVRIFNLVLADAELSIDVRLGAGLLLPSVVLRDNQVFRLYEGRVLIRNYLSLLLHELQHNIKLRTVAEDSPSPSPTQQEQPQQLQQASTTAGTPGQDADGSELPSQANSFLQTSIIATTTTAAGVGVVRGVVSGRAHLTQRELIAFAPRVIEALEQTFKVLGATPLTSDVASLTELPLYFFCADGKAPLGVALERSFTRVVVLWLIGLVGAQCDEDIDKHAMEVLLHLMSRAVTRASLPRDSCTTLMLNASGTATVVQISPVSGAAVPTAMQAPPGSSSSDWGGNRRPLPGDEAVAGCDGGSGGAASLSAQAVSDVGGTFATTADAVAMSLAGGRAGQAAPLAPLIDDDAGDLGALYRSHANNSLFDNTEFVGLAAAAGVDRAMAECGNTVEALGSVFRVLLGRSPDLLTPAGLATVLALFASHDSNVSRLGRECMMRSLETPSSYPLYADVIRDSDTQALTQTLSVISAYLNTAALSTVARNERRVWMQRSGCVDAVVRVLIRVLDSPHSTPAFMKIIPHLFQLLSAFESVDHKPPQLASTNFVAAVTERLDKLEGTEYFIIITQAVLDSCMGTYGGADDGYTSAGGRGAHYAEMQVVGNFHIAQYNCAAEKPVFLDLLPSLLHFAEHHSAPLYHELVEVLFRIVECTGNVRSDRLADFILDHGLSQMLPYMELSGPYIEERLPFTGSAMELHRFWQPVLLRAPRRSELRFTSYGGVQVSVGTWPDTGFTIATWFKFDRLYTTIPLFEFHGVMNESGSGGSSSPRGSSNLTALLFIFGGDSVQLTVNDARRTTVNESQALQNFVPNKWMHICAVLRPTQVLEVYVSGFKVGSTPFLAFAPGTEVRVNVGCTDEQPHHQYSSGTSSNAAPLYSMSDVTLWAQALSRSQVEAELASSDCRAINGSRFVMPAKIVEEAIPQELTLMRNMGNVTAASAVGSPGLTGGNFAGFAALINAKVSPGSGAGGGSGSGGVSNSSIGAGHDTRSVLGLSFATTASSAGGGGQTAGGGVNDDDSGIGSVGSGWSSGQSWLPISTRMARFVPYENEDNLLRNVLSNTTCYPVVAKLTGRYATPPKSWVDYPLLWATRGGVMRLLDWLHLVTSSAQLEGLLQLITECIVRTTLAVTLDPRTYMLFGYMLTHHVAAFFTNAACDLLLTLASSHINVFDEEHRIIINRLAFEHILGSVAFYAAIPLETALYLLQRVRRLFHASQCRYAKHNARFVIPHRFIDRLLHSLVDVATQTPLPLRRAVVQVAQQVVVACEMEEDLVQIFVSLVALLTPDEATVVSRYNQHVQVVLPTMTSMTHRKTPLPLRTANHLTMLLLSCMVECMPQGAFLTALARTVDLPWYATCLSRFADPASVVFATRLFFEAVELNPLLREEAMQNQAALIEALTVHAVHEDLVLLLLAQTVGAVRHVDVLSRKHSLLQQLDSVMNTFQAHPNSLVAPIFVKIFVVHLYRTMQAPHRQISRSTTVLLSEQRLSYRVRRCLSLVRVCSRLMILIRVRRYRALLVHRPLISAAETPLFGPAHVHQRTLSGTTLNMSFAQSSVVGFTAAPNTAAAMGNFSFASNARDAIVSSIGGGGPLQSATPQTPSLPGRSSAGGDGYADDGELPGNRSTMSGYSEARQLPSVFRMGGIGSGDPATALGADNDDGVDEAALQWKPPVLLPDMLSTPAPAPATSQQTTPRTLSLSHQPPTDLTFLAGVGGGASAVFGAGSGTAGPGSANASRRTPPLSSLTSPTSGNAGGVRHVHVRNGKQTRNLSSGSGSDNDEDDDEGTGNASSQHRVRSRKHKRAFAVLRVCVLMWLPIQVRRSRWIFNPHTQPYEEDYATRHASTLFCIRMFRHFAAVSSNFYLFVNSPLQIGALSALVVYISRDMLQEEVDTWDQMIRSMVVAPAREGASSAAAANAGTVANAVVASGLTVRGGTPTTYESSTTTTLPRATPNSGVVSTFPQRDFNSTVAAAPTDVEAVSSPSGNNGAPDEAQRVQQPIQDTMGAADESAASTTLPLVLPLPPRTSATRNDDDTPNASSPSVTISCTAVTSAGARMRSHVTTATPTQSTRTERKRSDAETAPGAGTATTAGALSIPALAPPLSESTSAPAGPPISTTRRMPRLSSMTFRSAESSSAHLDQMTVLESPQGSVQFVDDVEDGVASSVTTASRLRRRTEETTTMVGETSFYDGDASSLPNTSFDIEGPPLIPTTRVYQRWAFQQQQQSQQQLLQPVTADVKPASSVPAVAATESFLDGGKEEETLAATTAAAGAVASATSSPFPAPTNATAAAASGVKSSAANTLNTPVKTSSKSVEGAGEADNENDADGDDSSSVSSAGSSASMSSQSSVASTSSAPTHFSSAAPLSTSTTVTEKTALSSHLVDTSAHKAVNAPVASFSNLPDAPTALLAQDPTDAYAVNVAKVVAAVGEVVRRDAVGILRALIRSSLDTLPVPHWIGGPTYGSCGGLLFQLLLIVSAKAVADDATTTLVRFFLLIVGNAVKEQRDRELQPLRPDLTASPYDTHALLTAAPTLPGLGNMGSPLPMSRGAPISVDPVNNPLSNAKNNISDGAPLSIGNMSFASSAMMLPPPSSAAAAVGGASANTVRSHYTLYSSLAGIPMPLAPTQQSAFASSAVASSSPQGGAPRHTVQFASTPLTQRSTSSPFSHTPYSSSSNNPSSGSGVFSDVFLCNVNHFTDLIVDMLAINVLDLPMATHYFLTLLVLCQEWPSRYIDQLSWQVMRACIAVLNRPSMQDASVGLIESIYTLTTLVLRRGWKRKGVLECLFRVLYRVYGSLPPAWMSDDDARHRKRLITLIFRHIVQTYAGTKELEKALTARTLTQRLSLYDDFVMIFSLSDEAESTATFEQYCIAQSSSIETLMSGRLKAKADLAFKASIKTRSEYIKRIKAFNNQFVQVSEVADLYRKKALRSQYASRFSSYVATTPLLDASQLHWLLSSTCVLRDDHRVSAYATSSNAQASNICAAVVAAQDNNNSGASSNTRELQLEQMHRCGEATLYHFLDPQMNYGELKGILWGTEHTGSSGGCDGAAAQLIPAIEAPTASGPLSPVSVGGSGPGSLNTSNAPIPLDCTRRLSATQSASAHDAEAREAEQTNKNDLVRAAQCEGVVQHIAVLLPPFSTRCRPHIGDGALPMALKDLPIALTPSAMTLLRYIVPPHETLRFISNGFRINGIHATPCLILLTSTTLTIIGFSRVTEGGDIILCEYEDDDDDEATQNRANDNSTTTVGQDTGSKATPNKAAGRTLFSMSSMTKQFQKLFTDNSTKRRQQQDGTRVAQAVRQVMGRNYQNIFWSYLVGTIRTVRSLRYMHLDTAVQLQLCYDEGPMLSVVDAKQSMNPSARKEFLKVLKDVVAPQQCTFVDETQKAASMKSNLVRWATGALSNFEYLSFLNEVAGRTNRDLNQYPVYPWVLADYASATLDLESAATFRNFSYPMGAQTEARRHIVAQLFENTREVCDMDTGKSYPFHHGTHYSTSGGVLYFLLRVQPFTTYARLFQGGDFDLAMRLFDSVAASFSSCVMGPADCKELIPEFFVNNNFLANADHLLLGVKSDGEPVDDVKLPPWAKNSRQVFTAVMRYALESFYVVEHLHQWIDLIFGVRRRGPLAMERYNVFQRMTYGEEVAQALKDAETPHDCDVIIAEVDNFGQTPTQLFQERHPSHQELVPVVQGLATDGGGSSLGNPNNNNSGSGGGGGAGRGVVSNAGNASVITLGGIYTSVHASSPAAGAGTQLGSTFSNLISSGTFASGQTYTQAFRREAPKVVRMLIHAMDETQTWFMLRDPPSGVLQHPPPPALTDSFRNAHPAVVHFSPLHTSKKLACVYAQLVPVPDTDHYLCWHEREARVMRYTAGQATFQSMVAFNPPDESGAHISAVAVGARESVLLIAISTGAVYCLFPDDLLNGALHLRVTLCYHRNPVEKIVLDESRHRAVTLTRGHSDDAPILWRVQRSGCNYLRRLSMEELLPIWTDAELAATGQTAEDAKDARGAVDVAFDAISGHIVIATARSLVIFDNNGEPFGVGTLPSPNNVRAVDSVTLEDDNGDVGVVVGRAVAVMPNLSSVSFYETREWAAGMSVLVTGHVDGSISVWRCTRLPPDTVEPGKIAVVEFHARLFSGEAAAAAGTTAPSVSSAVGAGQDSGWAASSFSGRGGLQNRIPLPLAADGYTNSGAPVGPGGVSNISTVLAGHSGSPSTAAVASTLSSAGCVGTGTGATNCPVTCLHQERADVPAFLVGYESGSIRQLLFDDPALAFSGGGGGAGGGRDGSGGDDRNQRR
jgi:hypothetical protein